MALKSGSINLANDPTRASEWAASMAKAIEDAFISEWPIAMDGADAPEMNNQARLLFVAIAKGVVKHLTQNGSAFVVDLPSVADHSHTVNSGTTSSAGGHNHAPQPATITGTIDA